MARRSRSRGPRRRTQWVPIEAFGLAAVANNAVQDGNLLFGGSDIPIGSTILQTRLYVSAFPRMTTGSGQGDFTLHVGYLVVNENAVGSNQLDPNTANDNWMLIDSLGAWWTKSSGGMMGIAQGDGRAKWFVSNAMRKVQEGDNLAYGFHVFCQDAASTAVVDIGALGRVLIALP